MKQDFTLLTEVKAQDVTPYRVTIKKVSDKIPTLNACYQALWAGEYYEQVAEIAAHVVLDDRQWHTFANNLLVKYEFLRGRGGRLSDYTLGAGGWLDADERAKWLEQSYIANAVRISHTGQVFHPIVVNPHGWDYARYIGFGAVAL
jgi:hypothetical protein